MKRSKHLIIVRKQGKSLSWSFSSITFTSSLVTLSFLAPDWMLEESASSVGYPTTNNLLTSDFRPNDRDTVFIFPNSCHITKDMSMAIEFIFDSSLTYVQGTSLHCAELECIGNASNRS